MLEQRKEALAEAVDFIINEAIKKTHEVNKERLKWMVEVIHKSAVASGLPSKYIKLLFSRVHATAACGIQFRRQLLYSCVPERPGEFPHDILPCIVSTIYPAILTPDGVTRTWVMAVLSWLLGLLSHDVIDTNNLALRICFLPIFNTLRILKHVRVCSEVVCLMVKRVDVTPQRVRFLHNLRRVKGYTAPLNKLIRLFQTMRPDLVVVVGEGVVLSEPRITLLMQPALEALERRLPPDDDEDGGGALWPDALKRPSKNLHKRPSVLPFPMVVQYSSTLEHRKAERMNVMQCRNLRTLISKIASSEKWLWPNNPAALLRRPLLLLWFRPHDYKLQIQMEAWLDFVLTNEVLKERATTVSFQRSCDLLLRVTVYAEQLLLSEARCTPVIQQFLLTYLMLWDQDQNIALVLRLVRCLGYVKSFSSVVLSRLLPLVATAPLPLSCAILNALTDTAVNWCLHYHANADVVDNESFVMIEGVLSLTRRLDGVFIAATVQHSGHPMILHTCLNYYHQVNLVCDTLSLPLLVSPGPILAAVVVAKADLTTTHRLGKLLAKMHVQYNRIKEEFVQQRRYTEFCEQLCRQSAQHNKTLELYIHYCYDAQAFTGSAEDVWSPMVAQFLGENSEGAVKQEQGKGGAAGAVEQLRELKNACHSGSVVRNLTCASLFAALCCSSRDQRFDINNLDQYKYVYGEMLHQLEELGLSGLRECLDANRELPEQEEAAAAAAAAVAVV